MGIRQKPAVVEKVDKTIRAVVSAHAEGDARFRAICDALPVAIYSTDAEGRVTYFNRAAEEFAGRRPDIGNDLWCVAWKLFWPDGRPCPLDECPMAIALKEGRIVRGMEVLVERPDGTRAPVMPFPTLIRNGEGKVIAGLNLLLDLSEIKRTRAELSESESRLETITNLSPAIIWTAGPDGTLNWISDRWEEYTGLKLADYVQAWMDFVHPDDVSASNSAWEVANRTGIDFRTEVRVKGRDGAYRWFESRAVPIKDSAGNVVEWCGSIVDIHDRKEIESELRVKEAELELVARTTPIRLTRCSRDMRYLYVNEATASLFGMTPSEVEGRSIVDVIGEEAFETIRPYVERVLSGESISYDIEVPYKNAGKRWVHVDYVPDRDDSGNVTGWIASIIDITERMTIQSELERQVRQLDSIYKLSARVSETSDVQEIIVAALDALVVAVGADRASVLLFDEDGVMRFKGWRRLSKAYRDAVEGHSPWKPSDSEAKPITIGDVLLDKDLAPYVETITAEGIRALGFIPLLASGRVLGKFMVYFDQPHAFTPEEVQVCETIAWHVSYGIDRSDSTSALEASEERFRLATASGLVGVWDWDVVENKVTWSETTYKIHGIEPGDFKGTVESFGELVHAEDKEKVAEAIRKSLEEDVPYEIEFRVVQPGGRVVWLYTHARVLRDEAGLPLRMLGGTLDISQRKAAEGALRSSESKAREMSDRLRVLLGSTSHLIETLKTEDLLSSILELSQSIVDADAFGLWRRDSEQTWSLVASQGLSDEYVGAMLSGKGYGDIPTDPIVVQPEQMLEQSASILSSRWESYTREGIQSMLVIPLRIHGSVGGTLVFYCKSPHEFSQIEIESAQAMANIAAAAITTTELYEEQQRLRARAEADAKRETLLATIGGILASSLDYEMTLANIARATVPGFADWCAVDLVDADGALRRLAVAHVDPAKVELAHALHEKYPPTNESKMGVLQVIETGVPEMMSEIPSELIDRAAKDDEHRRIIAELQLHSYICVPLRLRGRVCGAISFVGAESGKSFEGKDLSVAIEIARRAGQAIERSEVYRDARANEERFRTVFQRSSVGKALVALGSQAIDRANESLCQLLGYSEEQLLSRQVFDIVHPEDCAKFSDLFRRMMDQESESFRDEVRLIKNSGESVWVIASTSLLHDAQGAPSHAIAAVQDITDRKLAEIKLSEQANTLATLNRTGATLAAETDLENLIQTVTDAGKDLTGAQNGAFFFKRPDGTLEVTAVAGMPQETFEEFDSIYTSVFGEETLRSDDVLSDVRFSKNPPDFPIPVRSLLTVPVVSRTGEILGGLMFAHSQAEVFSEKSERVINGIASQAAVAIDNAKLYEALSASEKKMRLITDSLPVLISYVDREERYQFVSGAYEKWFGVKKEVAEGKTMTELLGEAAREKLDPFISKVLGGERTDFQTLVPYKTAPRNVSVSYIPDKDEAGEVRGFFAMVEDVTARISAERAARTSDERLRQACEAAEMGVWRVDLATRLSTRDAGYNAILGFEAAESTQPYDEVFALVHPEDRPHLEAVWTQVFDERRPYDVEFRVLRGDGSVCWLREIGKFVRGEDGEADSMAGLALDITLRRELDAERLRASKLESIGVLAGGIAHDFNNILTAILGNVALANLYLDPESEAAERISAAEKACQRAQKLTQQLLTFSKGGQPVKGLVSLKEVLDESANFVLQGSNVLFVQDIPDDLPLVEADAGQIGQVIQNLVLNAAQSMPEGGVVTVGARRIVLLQERPPLSSGHYVEVSVSDTGHGIPAEHLQRIFDPFFTTKSKGSGLGLTTSYSILQRHGGHLEVESQVGAGTTFRFYLPASLESLSPKRDTETLSGFGSGRILVMDDEPAVCEIARVGLADFGYEVSTAPGGTEAVRLYNEARDIGRPFDVVVLDLTIRGDIGGKETIERLRAIDPNVTAIVASGYSNDPVLSKFKDYGFSGMIAKPFRTADLARAIAELIKSPE